MHDDIANENIIAYNIIMKYRNFIILTIIVLLSSCAPVLSPDMMGRGSHNIRFSDLRTDPANYRGRLYILGGVIVNTTITMEGSLIEAVYVPVDSRGYLGNVDISHGRFLALYRGRELLDPLIFREKREITLAGEFAGTRSGKIGEMEYVYPFFEIREIYLWEEQVKEYYSPYPYYPYYPSWYYYQPWRHDPWYGPWRR
ncbi:MAG: Slp family lipoprotein [Nitrospirae bacterium]|nr:Slp family lipoprotein [Nitrospirota bacterium]